MTRAAHGDTDPHALPARYRTSGVYGKRILYVDDDPLLRRATSRVLERAGAICLLAGSHEEAVTLVNAEPELALVILDFHMPDGDVGHLVKRLRTASAVLPVVGTSGADRRTDFAERGVPWFLEKPWQLGDLVRALNW